MTIPLEILLEKLKKANHKENVQRKHLELEILPEDAPPRDEPFPTAPPNKRVIIIDI